MKNDSEEEMEMATDSISEASRVRQIKTKMKFRTIDSSSLDGSVYRGEGNATLVVSLPSERKVLRFHKSDGNSGDEASEDDGETRVRLIVNFHRNVISGLMGNYSTEPEIVRWNDEDLKRWMLLYEPHRPVNRRHKRVVETFATTLPDYTLLPLRLDEKISSSEKRSTFCVEIKPKNGYNEDSELADTVCDYCQKQFEKARKGKISRASSYCPGDLFSGVKFRFFRALKGLVDSPQNNLRIFKNGKHVWGEEFDDRELEKILAEWFNNQNSYNENLQSMFHLIHEALLRPFPQYDSVSSDNSISRKFNVSHDLPSDSVLERIYRVQKNNHCNVDSIYHIYSSYSSVLDDEVIYSQYETVESAKIINNVSKSKMPSAEEIRALRNYLVNRIARDCSILMAFREIDSNAIRDVPASNVIELSDKRYFLFNNAITDLDPKNVHSIEKHHRRKNEILKVARQGQISEDPAITKKLGKT